MRQPVFETERLVLRPFALSDAPEVARLAGDRLIADTTASLPHPYEEKHAESWISTHTEGFRRGKLLNVAITDREDGVLYGTTGLVIRAEHRRAELGYWVGVPHWGNGYATEASRALIGWAFSEGNLNRVMARHMARNPASGRVMEKLGMRIEGTLRRHVSRGDDFDDIVICSILASEFTP